MVMDRSPLTFFLLVFAHSIPFWLIQPRDWPISVSVGAPLLAALILVYSQERGGRGVRRLLSRVFDQWRIWSKFWYVPIIFLMPLLYLLSYLGMRLLGLEVSGRTAPFLLVPLLFVLFFILAIGEEVGWMGYAVDPMQDQWSALTTSIILGLVTAIWHFVPLIQMGRTLIWIAGG